MRIKIFITEIYRGNGHWCRRLPRSIERLHLIEDLPILTGFTGFTELESSTDDIAWKKTNINY